jgi:hypothetical protein
MLDANGDVQWSCSTNVLGAGHEKVIMSSTLISQPSTYSHNFKTSRLMASLPFPLDSCGWDTWLFGEGPGVDHPDAVVRSFISSCFWTFRSRNGPSEDSLAPTLPDMTLV